MLTRPLRPVPYHRHGMGARTITRAARAALLAVIVAAALAGPSVSAQETASQPAAGGDDLRAKVQNPVGSLISVPLKNTFDFGAPDGGAYLLNIQPVIPITVGKWNLINRIIMPIISVEGLIAGTPAIPEGVPGDRATGLGDINYSLFGSPAEPGKVIWGIGPSINFPSATDDQLGSGKWSAGPTAVFLTQPKPWTLGVLGRQLWSFAGESDRPAVSQFLLEPFVNYNLQGEWYLVSDLIITANWDAPSDQRWTVPVGGGVGKLFTVGSQAMNARVETYYNVERPDAAPEWSLSFTVQFLFPK